MKLKFALALCALIAPLPALAQTAPGTSAPAPAHQPGVAAPKPVQSAPPTAASAAPAAPEKIDPAKEAAIRHLMDVTKASDLGDNLHAYVVGQVRQVMGRSLSADKIEPFMATFSQKLSVASPTSSITAAMVPIYARALSLEDIQGLVQFYESPLGQRTLKALPQITQQSENAGVQMVQKAAMDTLQGMTDQYPELKSMLSPPGASDTAPGLSPAAPPK
jgi:hypothetical protein